MFLSEIANVGALHNFELYAILRVQLTPQTFTRSPQIDTDPEFKAIADKFYSGSMPWSDYLMNNINFFSQKTNESFNSYGSLIESLKKQVENGTPWLLWKNIFVFLQIFLILISMIIGYKQPNNNQLL